MKQLWLGLGLLAAVAWASVAMSMAMEAVEEPICRHLETAADIALAGEPEAGWREADKAREIWERRRRFCAAWADHGAMEQIDSLFFRLALCAGERDGVEFAAVCSQISALMKAVGESHAFTWWNLL